MPNKNGIVREVTVLRKALKKDPGYYLSWQSNIAMAFYDEYLRTAKNGRASKVTLHDIANKAAKNFLDLLIRE